ncbi:NlpC/P60 family protein [Leptospira broomii serovar Hurstbridge str. 5399]|uniref:NlpC/P60 family protein n=1 Tax=Leptospira broomii serovar Hurstbridge str. 5399 TaxID=1049789 RepID=T0F9Z6_9LEPT|nr:NlpC/P60 family protein [Leptospira broomii]EQA44716.1 NlpC/P60 family protein [Leptospira broomii serovar Hurstbridge str. 5399]
MSLERKLRVRLNRLFSDRESAALVKFGAVTLFITNIFFVQNLIAVQAVIPTDSDLNDFFLSKWKIEIEPGDNVELYRAVYYWYGTSHKDFGKDEDGIDCSHLASKLIERVYHRQIAGSSKRLSETLKSVEGSDLREGDLVFFDIYEKGINHVGVYLKDRKFVHASVVRGVTVNSLDEAYYKKRFVMATRP